jgi:hypothetical protein
MLVPGQTGVIGVEEGLENAVSQAPEGAEGAHHSAGAEVSLNPAPVEAIMKKLDTPSKKMAAWAGFGVFVLAFFVFAYAMGLSSMKNSSSVSREAVAAAQAAQSAAPEAPGPSYTPPQTTGASELPAQTATAVVTPVAAETTKEPEAAKATVESPDTASSGSDAVLSGASKQSELPGEWKNVWTGSGKSTASAAWHSADFKLATGFFRSTVKFTGSVAGVTLSLVRVSPSIGKWALWDGVSPAQTITGDPRSIGAGTYRFEVSGPANFTVSAQQ